MKKKRQLKLGLNDVEPPKVVYRIYSTHSITELATVIAVYKDEKKEGKEPKGSSYNVLLISGLYIVKFSRPSMQNKKTQ